MRKDKRRAPLMRCSVVIFLRDFYLKPMPMVRKQDFNLVGIDMVFTWERVVYYRLWRIKLMDVFIPMDVLIALHHVPI